VIRSGFSSIVCISNNTVDREAAGPNVFSTKALKTLKETFGKAFEP
jgi:hypothetical protein